MTMIESSRQSGQDCEKLWLGLYLNHIHSLLPTPGGVLEDYKVSSSVKSKKTLLDPTQVIYFLQHNARWYIMLV